MRMGLLAGWIVAVALAWPQAASSGAPQIDRDEKGLKKYAVERDGPNTWDAKPRGLCVCLEQSAVPEYENKLGLIFFEREVETIGGEQRDMIRVMCYPFSYDRATGERTSYLACDGWIPLAR